MLYPLLFLSISTGFVFLFGIDWSGLIDLSLCTSVQS